MIIKACKNGNLHIKRDEFEPMADNELDLCCSIMQELPWTSEPNAIAYGNSYGVYEFHGYSGESKKIYSYEVDYKDVDAYNAGKRVIVHAHDCEIEQPFTVFLEGVDGFTEEYEVNGEISAFTVSVDIYSCSIWVDEYIQDIIYAASLDELRKKCDAYRYPLTDLEWTDDRIDYTECLDSWNWRYPCEIIYHEYVAYWDYSKFPYAQIAYFQDEETFSVIQDLINRNEYDEAVRYAAQWDNDDYDVDALTTELEYERHSTRYEWDGYILQVSPIGATLYKDLGYKPKIRTVYVVDDGYTRYVRCGDNITYDMPDGNGAQLFTDETAARAEYEHLCERSYMLKSWEREYECRGRIRTSLVYVVSLSTNIEEFDPDNGWVFKECESLESSKFDYDDYVNAHTWACPDCSGIWGEHPVLLNRDGDGFTCPECGCYTTAPDQDLCFTV